MWAEPCTVTADAGLGEIAISAATTIDEIFMERLVGVARPEPRTIRSTTASEPRPAIAPWRRNVPRAIRGDGLLADSASNLAGHSRLPTPVLTGSGSTGLSQPNTQTRDGTPDEYQDLTN